MGWRAGAGSERIAVPPGVALEGYAARTARSTHVHDPLLATALALAAGDGQPVVLVAADVVALDRRLCMEIMERTGLGPARLVVCATHTHSGPAGVTDACAPSGAGVDAGIRASVAGACVRAAQSALATLAPAELRLTRAASSCVVANRSAVRGARDRRVSALTARRPDGSAIAGLLLIACHPTVLGAASTAVSADLTGALRAALGGDAGTATVVTGAAADASTRFTRRAQDVEELGRLGRRLGAAARRALSQRPQPLEPILDVAEAAVELPRTSAPPDPELQRVRGESGACVLTAWRVGSSAWLFAPAELSTLVGRAIEAGSPFGDTLVVGYAGGYAGYVVDRPHYAAQTYEARASPFAPEAADALVVAAEELLERLS
jgi:hypothetical protein